MPYPGLPAKFGARQPINGRVVSGQTQPQTLLYGAQLGKWAALSLDLGIIWDTLR